MVLPTVDPALAYVVSHALTFASVVAWLVMLVRISGSRRTPESAFAWLLAFAFLPVVAIPLYLAFGSRKFPRRAKGRQLVVPPVRSGCSFELVDNGESAFARLIALIETAERSIDLTVFILGDDATGRAVVAALVASARRGVAVRVILDAVGSIASHRAATRALQAVGAEAHVFMPLRHSPVRGRTNLRSHRKIVIVDNTTVFAGGMNFAEDYMGLPNTEKARSRWRDVAAIARGPVAADATALFESDWAFCGGSKRSEETDRTGPTMGSAQPAAGDAEVQLVPSGPDMTTDTMYDLFLNRIFQARERIALVTPYYVPDDALQHALVLAARRGVKTEILMPAWSNHRVADLARRGLVRDLIANGVFVHYYTRGMVHAKAMVIDDSFAYVGSPNFDMRSLFLNYEDALCLHSPEAIAQVRGFVDGLISDCSAEPVVFPEHRVIEQLARLLAPEL